MKFSELIYPPRCLCCFKVVASGVLVCKDCIKDFRESANFIEYYTTDFDCISLYRYTECIRGAIYNVKYKKSLRTCRNMGVLLADEAENLNKRYRIDEVAYVPMTKKDIRDRGFNQCEVFARIASERLELEFKKDIIKKIRQTEPQKKLIAAQRVKNLKGAFKVDAELHGKTVLLIDDVTTTGTTLKETSKELLKAGARKVVALTFAKV